MKCEELFIPAPDKTQFWHGEGSLHSFRPFFQYLIYGAETLVHLAKVEGPPAL